VLLVAVLIATGFWLIGRRNLKAPPIVNDDTDESDVVEEEPASNN
jgi:hypothetical protein